MQLATGNDNGVSPVGRARARRPLVERKRLQRGAMRVLIARRTRRPPTAAQLAFDPLDADDAGAFPHPGLAQIHHVGALGGGEAAAAAADENDDRAVGFLDRDRMAQAIVVGHARRRYDIGGVLAGAERDGKTDQRSRQADGAPEIGGLP